MIRKESFNVPIWNFLKEKNIYPLIFQAHSMLNILTEQECDNSKAWNRFRSIQAHVISPQYFITSIDPRFCLIHFVLSKTPDFVMSFQCIVSAVHDLGNCFLLLSSHLIHMFSSCISRSLSVHARFSVGNRLSRPKCLPTRSLYSPNLYPVPYESNHRLKYQYQFLPKTQAKVYMEKRNVEQFASMG